MNNRIKELAEQAWDYVDAHCPYASEEQEMFEKKFAELIIQGCIGQVAAVGLTNSENEDILWASEVIIENIKRHFGVES
ncbi:MAG: hypothetical protein EB023_04390 [Flavobacteriia bacterium]|nr:hypothetical protein [Flavobacteriia bacterium]